MLSTLRQQGGATVLTVPNALMNQLGWQVGYKVDLEMRGDCLLLKPTKRLARGRKTVSQLLADIDSDEIVELNSTVSDMTSSMPVGNEVW